MRTSIVVPVFNQLPLTQLCLANLPRAIKGADWELLVIDNGSTDGTGAWLDLQVPKWPNLRVIHNPTNLGFGGACNIGMAEATGDGIVLLNNDAHVTLGWLSDLWQPLLDDPGIGLSGPVSNCVIPEQSVPGPPEPTWDSIRAYARSQAITHAGQGRETHRLSGFCLLIRRTVIDAIGGFDPRFGLGYFEDDDYSLRAGLAGFRLWICDNAYVHHIGMQTSRTLGDVKMRLETNRHVFAAKWGLAADNLYDGDWRPADVAEAKRQSEAWYVPLVNCPLDGGQ